MRKIVSAAVICLMFAAGCSNGEENIPEPSNESTVAPSATPTEAGYPFSEGEIFVADFTGKILSPNMIVSSVKEKASIKETLPDGQNIDLTTETVYDNSNPNLLKYESKITNNLDNTVVDLVSSGLDAKFKTAGSDWESASSMVFPYFNTPYNVLSKLTDEDLVKRAFYEGVEEGLHKFRIEASVMKSSLVEYVDEDNENINATYFFLVDDDSLIRRIMIETTGETIAKASITYDYSDYNNDMNIVFPE